MAIKEALTSIKSRKQQAIAALHRMEVDDERLAIELERLEITRQRFSSRVDLDALFDSEDLALEL